MRSQGVMMSHKSDRPKILSRPVPMRMLLIHECSIYSNNNNKFFGGFPKIHVGG